MDFNGNMMLPSNFGAVNNGTNMGWDGQSRGPAHGNSMGYGNGVPNMRTGNSTRMGQPIRQQVASQFAVPMANGSFPVSLAAGNSTNMAQPMGQQVAFQSTVPMAYGTFPAPMPAPQFQAPVLPMGYGNVLTPQSTGPTNMFALSYRGAMNAPLPQGNTAYAPIGAHQHMAGFPQQRLPAHGQVPNFSMGYNQLPVPMPAGMGTTAPTGYGIARPTARVDLTNKPATAAEIVDLTQDDDKPTAPAVQKAGTKRKGTASPEKPAKRTRYGVLETPVIATPQITPLKAAKPPASERRVPAPKVQNSPRKDPHNLMGSLYYTRIKQPVNTRLQEVPQDEPQRPVYDPRNFADENQIVRRRRRKAKTAAAEPQKPPRKRNGESQVKARDRVARTKLAGSKAPRPVAAPVQPQVPAVEAEQRSNSGLDDSDDDDDAEGSEDEEYEQQQPARTPAALPPQPVGTEAEVVINGANEQLSHASPAEHPIEQAEEVVVDGYNQQPSPASPTPQPLKQAEEIVINEDSQQPSPASPVPQLIEDEPEVIVNDTDSLFSGSIVSLEDDGVDAIHVAAEPADDGLLYLEVPVDADLLFGRRKLYLADNVPDYVLKDATEVAAWQAEDTLSEVAESEVAESEAAAVSEDVAADAEEEEEELDFDALFTAAFKQAADEESDEDEDKEDDEDGDEGDNACRYQSSDEEISEDES